MIIKAIIEMPTWGFYKYEIEKGSGKLVLDRPLTVNVPANYGYVPNTLAPDGDPLDIFVGSTYPLIPTSVVKAGIYGLLVCNDNGQSDDKLVGFLQGEDHYDQKIFVETITDYLNSYKEGFKVLEYKPVESFDLAAYLREVTQ